ncbi:MAG: barstar family protein [Bryobacteraceae bacterium]|jgi:hypothetical protein
MEPVVIRIPVDRIADWVSFHDVFQHTLGFPDFYGRNMHAWIDCMTSVDTATDGLTAVTVPPGAILILRIDDPFDFKRRCPEQYDALIECSAFVNFRRTEIGESPVLALLLNGSCEPR